MFNKVLNVVLAGIFGLSVGIHLYEGEWYKATLCLIIICLFIMIAKQEQMIDDLFGMVKSLTKSCEGYRELVIESMDLKAEKELEMAKDISQEMRDKLHLNVN